MQWPYYHANRWKGEIIRWVILTTKPSKAQKGVNDQMHAWVAWGMAPTSCLYTYSYLNLQ